jgi:hypothetical protein
MTSSYLMVWTYEHADVSASAGPTRTFACALECRPCAGTTNRGDACRRRVCIWLPYCWQHMDRHLGVRVGSSRALPGSKGLFATRHFKKGDMVAPYVGETVTPRTIEQRYGHTWPYSLGPYLLSSVDAACVRGVGSASNGAFGAVPKTAANVTFHPTSTRQGVVKQANDRYGTTVLSADNLGVRWWSFATRDVDSGEEIVAYYGNPEYEEAYTARLARCRDRGVVSDRTVRKSSKRSGA